MEAAFAWLGDLVNFIGRLLPRLVIIKATHAGVRFKYGRYVHNMLSYNGLFKTGLHVYWPFVTEIATFPVKRQTVNLPFQTLTTTDGQPVSIGGIVTFEIIPEEIHKTLAEIWDADETIRDIALATISDVLLGKSSDEIYKSPRIVKKKITYRLSKKLRDYGIKVIYFSASDLTNAFVFRNLSTEHFGQVINATPE